MPTRVWCCPGLEPAVWTLHLAPSSPSYKLWLQARLWLVRGLRIECSQSLLDRYLCLYQNWHKRLSLLDALSVRVHTREVLPPLPNTCSKPFNSPPFVFLTIDKLTMEMGYVILLKHKVSSMQIWLVPGCEIALPRQRRCSHFHKLSHYFSSFLNLLSVCVLISFRYANSNQFV